MVGENGRVFAVDVQREMIDFTRETAERRGLLDRVTLHLCESDDIGLTGVEVDFALAFFVVHEVPDRRALFTQLARLLRPGALFMMIEPKRHAPPPVVDKITTEAEAVGLNLERPLHVFSSRGALFRKA